MISEAKGSSKFMSILRHRNDTIGCIGVACIAFGWFIMLAPKRFVKPILPALDVIGPFSWVIILAMMLLPMLAAKRGSKWWWAVAAVGTITFADMLYHALD